FRRECLSSKTLHSFLSNLDPDLATQSYDLSCEWDRFFEKSTLIKDESSWLNLLLKNIETQNLYPHKNLKKIYWLGFVFFTPLHRKLIHAIEKNFPQMEQILLFQKGQKRDLQDEASLLEINPEDIFNFINPSSSEPEVLNYPTRFHEMSAALLKIQHWIQNEKVSPKQIGVFLPPEDFYWHHLTHELDKTGLLLNADPQKKLIEFAPIAQNLDLKRGEKNHLLDIFKHIEEEFHKNPNHSQAEALKALSQFEDLKNEIYFYIDQISILSENDFSLSRISSQMNLKSPFSDSNSIQLRSYHETGLKSFDRSLLLGLSEQNMPSQTWRFFGMKVPSTATQTQNSRNIFQNLLLSSSKPLLLTSTHSEQASEMNLSPFFEEWNLKPKLQNNPLYFSSHTPFYDWEKRVQSEKWRTLEPEKDHLYSGKMEDPQLLDQLKNKIQEHQFSPTQLETYTQCPFRFFVSTLLKVKSPDEELPDGNAAERGNWIHGFLEGFFDKYTPQIIQAIHQNEMQKELLNIIPHELNEFSQIFLKDKPWIHPLLSKDFSSRAILVCQNLLKEFWSKNVDTNAFVPRYFEKNFEISLDAPNRTPLKIRGKIDRIDLNASETEFIVYDYKTGETQGLSSEIIKFKKFQLPLYLLAAEEFLKKNHSPLIEGKGALAISLKEMKINEGLLQKSEKKRLHFKGRNALWDEDSWDLYWRNLKNELFRLRNEIQNGNFSLKPDPCDEYCEMKYLCRYHEKNRSYY
ncbi:MAG: PD-(D/E)XK nuclease family protein, partial [Deltaproteobacteria bacterium]|nr:PD-(D/E)XK nuclease family protein [Deltaproteobacteria bacterium]